MQMGYAKIAISDQYLASSPAVNAVTARRYQHGTAGLWQVVTLISDSKRPSLLMAGDDDEMFMMRSLNVTPKTTEQHLIARRDKSVAYVTNNKKLRSTFCTVEAKLLTDTKHRAASLRQQGYLLHFTILLSPCNRVNMRSTAA